ncbi:MAG: hypothetical protein HC850_17345 [Rhodomicrobium sp.]|nr:hypothetical protein [Rhodomicrobium sp.]
MREMMSSRGSQSFTVSGRETLSARDVSGNGEVEKGFGALSGEIGATS